MSTEFNTEHMFTYLKGFCTAMNWNDALNALLFARKLHDGQKRKGGQPYIIHPLTIACHALALGIKDETVVAGALLHDVPEDCGVKVEDLPVQNPEIKDVVRRLTHVKPTPLVVYYRGIAESPKAIIIKLLDRCDNVSTMAGVFTTKKTMSYIQETYEFVMPLYRKAKTEWPQYSNALFVLKYHITSVVDGLQACILSYEADVTTTPIGKAVLDAANKHSITLYYLSTQASLNYDRLLETLKGQRKASKDVLKNIADALEIDVAILVDASEKTVTLDAEDMQTA